MFRSALTLVLVAGLSSWAAAVSSAVPSKAEQAHMLEANRDLLAALLVDGLAVSDAGDNTLDRITACRSAADTLSRALDEACKANNPNENRVAELSDHLGEVLTGGLLATLRQARTEFREGSPGYEKFQELDKQSVTAAKAAADLIPLDGRLGNRPAVRDARSRLVTATGRVAAGE